MDASLFHKLSETFSLHITRGDRVIYCNWFHRSRISRIHEAYYVMYPFSPSNQWFGWMSGKMDSRSWQLEIYAQKTSVPLQNDTTAHYWCDSCWTAHGVEVTIFTENTAPRPWQESSREVGSHYVFMCEILLREIYGYQRKKKEYTDHDHIQYFCMIVAWIKGISITFETKFLNQKKAKQQLTSRQQLMQHSMVCCWNQFQQYH